MVNRTIAPIKINESVYWLGSVSTDNFIQSNVYLIYHHGTAILIDPGPLPVFDDVFRVFNNIAGINDLKTIIVTNSDPDNCASLPLWERHGFSGAVVAHWRTALLLPSYGLDSLIYNIDQNTVGQNSDYPDFNFIPMAYLPSPGALAVFYKHEKTLFSGELFGAIGSSMSLYADDNYDRKMLIHHEHSFSSSELLVKALEQIELLEPAFVCPQHGSIITDDISYKIETLKKTKAGKLSSSFLNESEEDSSELDELRKLNFELQENLILTNDEKLKDPVTGLYNEIYYNSYLPLFIEKNRNGVIVYLRLDDMRDFNNSYGFTEGDRTIAVFARIILENKPAGCILCRSSGPILVLMIPETLQDEAVIEVKELQAVIAESEGFIKQMTCSAAMIGINEITDLSENPQEQVRAAILTRLKVLDRMGNNSICYSGSGLEKYADEKTVMIIDSDRNSADMLKAYFNSSNYKAIICTNGFKALHLIDIHRPVVILSEANVNQLDGFGIRQRLLATSDLKDIPFILVSHLKTETSIRRAYAMKINFYFKKPVSLVELLCLVDNLVSEQNAT